MIWHIYTGSYTGVENRDGICQFALDTDRERLRLIRTYGEMDNPSFLCPTRGFLYGVSERDRDGMVGAYRRDPVDGTLSFLGGIPTRGDAMCHLNVWPGGRFFSAANYMSGSVFTGSIRADGSPEEVRAFCQHEGVGYYHGTKGEPRGGEQTRWPAYLSDRQQGPHVHCTQLSQDGKRLYVSDLGLDQIFCYEVGENAALTLAGESDQIHLPQGEGPRHFLFRREGKFLYVVAELGSKVFVYASGEDGRSWRQIQSVSTLPEGYAGENTAAELSFSGDGRFLYVSNRGMDSLVQYEVDGNTGLLTTRDYYDTYGRCPRNFCITPDDQYLLVANQESGNLVLRKRDINSGEPGGKMDEVFVPQISFVTAVS